MSAPGPWTIRICSECGLPPDGFAHLHEVVVEEVEVIPVAKAEQLETERDTDRKLIFALEQRLGVRREERDAAFTALDRLYTNARSIFEKRSVRNWDEVLAESRRVLAASENPESTEEGL